ncbi:MAG: BatA domain-containing protein [Pirellulales bacterium]|nr:BatA domain-containing protein [Pirellulales bacterium]
MPTFVYPSLLWGLLIISVPVLIHLINMMRHHRVRWAAMEFLLASHKKNRTWVLLKQLLLLLLRMAIVAVVVAAIAQPLLRSDLAGFLGHSKTHHIILLDDSFSMSDRWADTSVMERGKAVIQRIGTVAAERSEQQVFTLLRFSRAGQVGSGTQPDILEEAVDTQFAARLAKLLEPITASQTAADPLQAVAAVEQLLGESDGERRVVYLVSDFRSRDWNDPEELRQRLRELSTAGVELRLVNCVESARPNLAISSLHPASGTRVAGVPLFMEVTLENFDTKPARNVSVVLQEDGHSRPAVKVSEIPSRGMVKQRFQASFPTSGEHCISARLQDDAVAADNSRWAVVDLPTDVPVLIIDDEPKALDGWFLQSALSPGGSVRTGISARIETSRYLNMNSLDEFDSIYLCNVDRLDTAAIEALEAYVSAGGGLAVFLGPRTRSLTVNEELYRNGEGFFPLPLGRAVELEVDRLEQQPDLDVVDHPLFEIFKGERNSFLGTVSIDKYFATTKNWTPVADSGTQVIGRLRNAAPLIVESRFGKGRVVTFLTTASPTWNNWARNNPSFVVIVQELQSYIARRSDSGHSRLVGNPLDIELDADSYAPAVRFLPPADMDLGADTTGANRTETGSTIDTMGVMVNATPTTEGLLRASLPKTDRAGIYEAQLTNIDGRSQLRRYAINVDATEGDLQTIPNAELRSQLAGVDYEFLRAVDFELEALEEAGYNLGDFLLCMLVLMLLGEQILAYSASYHPPIRPAMGTAQQTVDVTQQAAGGWGGS